MDALLRRLHGAFRKRAPRLTRAILVTGSHEFFVDEAAETIRASLASPGTDVERISDEDLADRLPIALTHGSLVRREPARRGRSLGALRTGIAGISPGRGRRGVEQGHASGRREAFKKTRALLVRPEDPGSRRKKPPRRPPGRRGTRRRPRSLLEILRALPGPIEDAAPAASAVLEHLEAASPGTILLARAVDPPKTSPLYQAFRKHGTIQDVSSKPEEFGRFLASRAKKLAAEKDVALEPAAVEALLRLTEADPRRFDSELEKVLDWAESGGRGARPATWRLSSPTGAPRISTHSSTPSGGAIGPRRSSGSIESFRAACCGRGTASSRETIPCARFSRMIVPEVRRTPDRASALRRDANEDRAVDHVRDVPGPRSSRASPSRPGRSARRSWRGAPTPGTSATSARRNSPPRSSDRSHRLRGRRRFDEGVRAAARNARDSGRNDGVKRS